MYEGFFNLIGLIIGLLLFFRYKKLKNFTISLYYVLWYGLVRGTLEFLKLEHKNFPGTEIGIVQVIAYTACIVAFVLMVLNQKGIIRFQSKIYNEAGDSLKLLAAYDRKVVEGVIIEGKSYYEACGDEVSPVFRPAGEYTLAERQMRAVVFGRPSKEVRRVADETDNSEIETKSVKRDRKTADNK